MEGFSYYDIFQTKGIEYIIIIFFLLILIPFWIFINKESKIKKGIQKLISVITLDSLRIPGGIYFNPNHTWIFLNKSGIAEVGLDDWLIRLIGNAKLKILYDSGFIIKKGEVIAEIEKDGKILQLFSPITGVIKHTNSGLTELTENIGSRLFTEGWIYKIEPSNWKAEAATCFVGNDATYWFKKELEHLKDFISFSAGKFSSSPSTVILQEGGELTEKVLEYLPDSVWKDFQDEFLDKNIGRIE